MKIRWLPVASAELHEYLSGMAVESPDSAAKMAAAIDKELALLLQVPAVPGSPGPRAGIFKLVVTKYRKPPSLYFRKTATHFEILHLLAPGRNWPEDIEPEK